jgi:hypothetical protein
VLLLEVEHGGVCEAVYGIGRNGINNFNFLIGGKLKLNWLCGFYK